jgi:hypothetical protein
VSMNKWTQMNLFKNILLMSMEYFLTHGMNIWWHGGIFCHMDMVEQYYWMKKWMNFYKRWMPNLWKSWTTHYFTHKGWNNFMLILSWKKQHTEMLGNILKFATYFLNGFKQDKMNNLITLSKLEQVDLK